MDVWRLGRAVDPRAIAAGHGGGCAAGRCAARRIRRGRRPAAPAAPAPPAAYALLQNDDADQRDRQQQMNDEDNLLHRGTSKGTGSLDGCTRPASNSHVSRTSMSGVLSRDASSAMVIDFMDSP